MRHQHAPLVSSKGLAHVRIAWLWFVELPDDFVVTGIAAAGGDFRTHSRALVKACKDGSIQHYDG